MAGQSWKHPSPQGKGLALKVIGVIPAANAVAKELEYE
jgi:hypothetical protein